MEKLITNDFMDTSLSFNRRNLSKFKRVYIWKNLKLDAKDTYSFFLLNDLKEVEKMMISTTGQLPFSTRRMLYESSPKLESLFISQYNLPLGRNLRSHFPKLKEINLDMVKIVQLLSKVTKLPHKSLKKLLFNFEDPNISPRFQKKLWHRLILLYPQLECLRDSCYSRSFFCMENILLRRHNLHLRELTFNTVSWEFFDEDEQDRLPCKFTELNCSLYKKVPRLETFKLFTTGIQKLSLQISVNLTFSDYELLFSSLPNVQDLFLKFYSGVNCSIYLFFLLYLMPNLQKISLDWSSVLTIGKDFLSRLCKPQKLAVLESLAVHHKNLDSAILDVIVSAVDLSQLQNLELGGLTKNGLSSLGNTLSSKTNRLTHLSIKGRDFIHQDLKLFFKQSKLENLETVQIVRTGNNFDSDSSRGLVVDERMTPLLTEFTLVDTNLNENILQDICMTKNLVRNLMRLIISGENDLSGSIVRINLESLILQAEEFQSLKYFELSTVILTVTDVINLICCPFPYIETIVALASPKVFQDPKKAIILSKQFRFSKVKRIKVNHEVVLSDEFKRLIVVEQRFPFWKEIQLPQSTLKNSLIKKTQNLVLGKNVKWISDEKKFLRLEPYYPQTE